MRYFSDRLGADEDEIFRSLRPRTPEKRKDISRRTPAFFDERYENNSFKKIYMIFEGRKTLEFILEHVQQDQELKFQTFLGL